MQEMPTAEGYKFESDYKERLTKDQFFSECWNQSNEISICRQHQLELSNKAPRYFFTIQARQIIFIFWGTELATFRFGESVKFSLNFRFANC